jgi:hypothetical protein
MTREKEKLETCWKLLRSDHSSALLTQGRCKATTTRLLASIGIVV